MKRARAGMTLIEMLVVIGIVGILLAILIPAVQSARESARRVTCQNNLRQLSHAVQNHEASHGALPNLYFGTFLKQPRTAFDEFHFHLWRTAILPQLEQTALYERIDLSLAATVAANQSNLNTPIPLFVCPSTSIQNTVVPGIFEYNNGAIPTKNIGTAARSDYEAIAGVNYNVAVTGSGDLSAVIFGPWGETQYDANRKPLSYRPGRFANVSDGLSNTILIGEAPDARTGIVVGIPSNRIFIRIRTLEWTIIKPHGASVRIFGGLFLNMIRPSTIPTRRESSASIVLERMSAGLTVQFAFYPKQSTKRRSTQW